MKVVCTIVALAAGLLVSCEKSPTLPTADIIALKYDVQVPADIPKTISTPVSLEGYYHQAEGIAVYKDFHKTGWDNCIYDFINDHKIETEPAPQGPLLIKAQKQGYEQCQQQIKTLSDKHSVATVRRLLRQQYVLKLSKK